MHRIRMGVVADDITGANDIGIMFAKAGYETHVYSVRDDGTFPFRTDQADKPDICILDTNSRLDTPPVAYRKVFAATQLLQAAGCEKFHNKTCSVFRGNIGAEFDAMLDALQKRFAVVVLGFPKNGRQTIDGIHFVRGVPLASSEFRNDPMHPMSESNLITILQKQTQRRVGRIGHEIVARGAARLKEAIAAASRDYSYVILDVQDQQSLAVIAEAVRDCEILCGSSAIAEELPAVWEPLDATRTPVLPPPPKTGILCVAGSLMPQTRDQIEHLRASGVQIIEIPTVDLLCEDERQNTLTDNIRRASVKISEGIDVVLHASNDTAKVEATRLRGRKMGLTTTEISRLVSGTVAEAAQAVLSSTGADRFITAGGETSAAVTQRLGIEGLRLLQEIEPGLPSCVTLAPPYRWCVLKSGSFGSRAFLEHAMRHLKTVSPNASEKKTGLPPSPATRRTQTKD